MFAALNVDKRETVFLRVSSCMCGSLEAVSGTATSDLLYLLDSNCREEGREGGRGGNERGGKRGREGGMREKGVR